MRPAMTITHDEKSGVGRRGRQYIGCCLMCEDEKIRGMLRRARPITYTIARRAIGPAVLDAWASSMGLTTGSGGRQLKADQSLTYFRSRYVTLPCVYIVHQRVRHIFCLRFVTADAWRWLNGNGFRFSVIFWHCP